MSAALGWAVLAAAGGVATAAASVGHSVGLLHGFALIAAPGAMAVGFGLGRLPQPSWAWLHRPMRWWELALFFAVLGAALSMEMGGTDALRRRRGVLRGATLGRR